MRSVEHGLHAWYQRRLHNERKEAIAVRHIDQDAMFFECGCCQSYLHDRESTAACLMRCEGYYFVLLVLGNAAK